MITEASAHGPVHAVDAAGRRVSTARTYPAVAGALLITALLAGCSIGDPGEAADQPEVAHVSSEPTAASADPADPPAEPIEPAAEPVDPAADGAARADDDPRVVPIEQVSIDPAAVSTARTDPTLQGAIDTAYHFIAAWLHGITTGDTALLTELSLPSCTYCAGIPKTIAAEPRTVADGFTARMTGTLVAATEARTEYPYPVITLGVDVQAMHTQEVDGIAFMNLLDPQRMLLHLAMDGSEAGWAVHGIAHDAWPEET